MKLRTQLVLFAMALIVITSIASMVGAAYLTSVQTIRQNEDRLHDAIEGLERRIETLLAQQDRQFSNYAQNPSYPSRYEAEINRLHAGTMEMNEFGTNPLVEGLYNLGIASNVSSFALYIPHESDQPMDELLYVYDPSQGGLVGSDSFGSTLYTLNFWGTFDMETSEAPQGYPTSFVSRGPYYFEKNEQSETVLVFQYEYLSLGDIGHIKTGEHLGHFVFKKALEPSWSALDKEIGVHYNVYDFEGHSQGGQLAIPLLDQSQFSGQVRETTDSEGKHYDTLAKKLIYQNHAIGFLSASIPRQLTQDKIEETLLLLLMVALSILSMVFLLSYFFAGRIVRPISEAITLLHKISSGEKDVSHRLIESGKQQMYEIREFFVSFNDMLLALHTQKAKVDQYIEKIENLRDYYERIVDSIQTSIISINQNYQIENVNRVFTQNFENTKTDLIGNDVRQVDLVFLDEQILQKIQAILEGKSISELLTKRVPQRLVYEIKLFPFSIHSGSHIELGCLLLVFNISQKVELEEKIIHAEKLASLSMLSAGVAHEINNPLSSIVSNVHNLLAHPNLTDEDRSLSLNWIQTEALRIEKIISQLLDFSRTDKGTETHCDVNLTITQVINLLQLSKKHPVSITPSFDPLVESAFISEGELKQIVLNLVQNAIHACGTHGKIVIETGRIEADDRVQIKVRDNGTGIEEEHLPYIFDPFYSSKLNGEGTGLGLSMVYGIVQKYDGEIQVKSQVGTGTTFELRLNGPELLNLEEKHGTF